MKEPTQRLKETRCERHRVRSAPGESHVKVWAYAFGGGGSGAGLTDGGAVIATGAMNSGTRSMPASVSSLPDEK
ncbi:MAG: hypothetical protein ACO1Q7_10980 [Gemmatimonas sp.]